MSYRNKYIHYCVRILCMVLALLVCLPANIRPAAEAASDGMLRVKLTRLGTPSNITFKTTCDYYLASDPSVRIPSGSTVKLAAADGTISATVGSATQNLGSSPRFMRSKPGKYGVQFTSPSLANTFCGDLLFAASGNAITTVLNIYIEDYLYGVVGYEISPSSNIEAIKAQAVAARNYALKKKSSKSSSAAYHLVDNTNDQVFKGYNSSSSYASVTKAVDATKGGVLYYGGSLASCYYSASNGGQTESTKNIWGGNLAYSTVKDDPYDYESSGTKKTATIKKDATGLDSSLKSALIAGLAEQLKALGCSTEPADVAVHGIESIVPCNPKYASPSRVYKTLTFKMKVTGKKPDGETVTGSMSVNIPTFGGIEDWYSLSINSAANETVWVTETDNAFQICFRRNGHGVGMSQRGAQIMAKNYGKTVLEILEFYYPGTKVAQLSLADSTKDVSAPEPSAPAAEIIATARLNAAVVMYDETSESGMKVADLAAGATVDIYAVKESWAAVGSSGKYGYISTDHFTGFTLKGVAATQPETATYARTAADAALLQLPVSGAKTLYSLAAGNYVQVHAYAGQWAYVEAASGAKGYADISGLTLVTLEPTPTPTPQAAIVAPENLYGLLKQAANLYATRSESGQVLESLQAGSYVKAIAYDNTWVLAASPAGYQGYIKLSVLKPVKGQPTATPAPTPTIEGGEITKISGTKYVYAKADGLNVYSGCSVASKVQAILPKGTKMQVGAYNSLWACVRVNGAIGFVRVNGVSTSKPADESGNTVVSNGFTKVSGTKYAYAKANGVSMYESYSTGSDQIATLSRGDKVQVGAYNSVWACVRIEGVTGFIKMDNLTAAKPASSSGGNSASGGEIIYKELDAVTTAKLTLYQKASISSKKLGTIVKGTKVRVYAYNRECAYVNANGKYGFLALAGLRQAS